MAYISPLMCVLGAWELGRDPAPQSTSLLPASQASSVVLHPDPPKRHGLGRGAQDGDGVSTPASAARAAGRHEWGGRRHRGLGVLPRAWPRVRRHGAHSLFFLTTGMGTTWKILACWSAVSRATQVGRKLPLKPTKTIFSAKKRARRHMSRNRRREWLPPRPRHPLPRPLPRVSRTRPVHSTR